MSKSVDARGHRTGHWVRSACLALVVGGVGGCRNPTSPGITTWEGELEPVPPATVQGSVAVLSRSDRSEASIQIAAGQPEVVYRWRIRSGRCQDAGEVVGGTAMYPELEADASGAAEANATLSREMDPNGQYVARVLRDAEGAAEEVVACGNLRRVTF